MRGRKAACQGLIEGFAQAGEGALARKYREICRAAAEKIERASGFQIDRPMDGLSISDRIISATLQDRGQTQVALDWAKSSINPAAITPSDKSDRWQNPRAQLAAAYVRDGQFAAAQRIIELVDP